MYLKIIVICNGTICNIVLIFQVTCKCVIIHTFIIKKIKIKKDTVKFKSYTLKCTTNINHTSIKYFLKVI